MSRIEQKGFFLIETLIVTTIVSMAMIFLYTQMTQLLSSYELRLTYNTVEGMYAAANMNDYILADGKYGTITTDPAIASNGFLDFDCTTFSSAEYCNVLKAEMNIEKMIITTYNTADIKAAAPTEISFSDGLKLFISNIKNENSAGANEFRLIIEFSDKTFATSKLTDGDKTSPVITGNSIFYYRAGTIIDASEGLVATDNVYGDISDNIVCTFVAGNTYNCSVKDSNGNVSDTFVRTVVEGEEPGPPGEYVYRRKLTIDHTKIDADLTNFPVTVNLTESNFDFSKLTDQVNGYDLRFVDSVGNPLAFERDFLNKEAPSSELPDPVEVLATTGSSYFNKNVDKYEFRGDRDGVFGKYLSMANTINYTSDFDVSFKFKITAATFTTYGSWSTFKIGTNTDIPGDGGSTEGIGFVLWYDNDFSATDNVTFDFAIEGDQMNGVTGSKQILTMNEEYKFRVYQLSGTIYMELRDSSDTVVKSYNYSNAYTGDLKYLKISNNYIDTTTSWFTGEIFDFDFLTSPGGINKAVYHVKVPDISSTAVTDFYVEYNSSDTFDQSNKELVWDSNYIMVQHMGDSLEDSTANNHDGVNHSTSAVDSLLGKGRSGGGTSYIDFGFKAAAGTLTVSQVFNANSGDRYTLSDSGDAGYLLHQLLADGTGFQVYIGDNYVSPNQFPTTVLNTYHYSYITSDGTNNYFSVNNAAPSTNALGFAGNVGNLYGLNNGALDRGFSGVVDEIRISNIKRSDAWLKAEYNSLLDTLLTYGTETNI